MYRYRLLIANAVLLLALLGSHWGRRIEGAAIANPDFLRRLDLPFRGWKTQDGALTKSELDLLQPDAVLVRRYRSPDGDIAELAVIAGHRKRTVHTPGYCMVGGGWEVLTQQGCDLPLPGGPVQATRQVMAREGGSQLVATYFFTDGEYHTRNVVQLQGVQLLKRLRSRVPLGALVRILVPVRTDPESATRLSDAFARATVPAVLAGLRRARVVVH